MSALPIIPLCSVSSGPDPQIRSPTSHDIPHTLVIRIRFRESVGGLNTSFHVVSCRVVGEAEEATNASIQQRTAATNVLAEPNRRGAKVWPKMNVLYAKIY